MNHKKRIEEILYEYEEAGLIEKNFQKVLDFVADDIIGIGMGEQGFISSKKDLEDIIRNTVKEDEDAVFELELENVWINLVTENTASVCAKVIVKKYSDDAMTVSSFQQSLTLVYREDDWVICSLHASPCILSREGIEAYPFSFAEQALAQIKKEVAGETVQLMNNSFSGGILCISGNAGQFPLYFANDGLLKFMGYSKQEFHELFKNDISSLFYYKDKDSVLKNIESMLEGHVDLERKFRILGKNGEVLWVIAHAKKIEDRDKDGNVLILAVLTDVTEMMEMQSRLEKQTQVLEEQAEELKAQTEELIVQTEELEEQANALQISEERFRIALGKTSNRVFDYDVMNGSIIHLSSTQGLADFKTNIVQAKEKLIIGGTILDDFLEEFYQALERVKNGHAQEECIVKVKMTTDRFGWYRISMTGIKSSEDITIRIIGLVEDITKQKRAEIAYEQEVQYRAAVLADTMASYVVNFTEGVLEKCQIRDEHCIACVFNQPYDEFMEVLSRTLVDEESRLEFLNVFSRYQIMRAFELGETEKKLEYNILCEDGSDVWVQTIIRFFIDSTTNERKGFVYIMNIDERKRKELALSRKSQRDMLTDLYNKVTTENLIKEKLNTIEGRQTGVLLMLDIDFFKSINDNYGHPFGDTVLVYIANVLKNNFRKTDIIGRVGGDEFCVFFSGIRSKKGIQEIANIICCQIQNFLMPQTGGIELSCSIGISICGGKLKSFEEIYKEADTALYQAKEKGRNQYAFFEKSGVKE